MERKERVTKRFLSDTWGGFSERKYRTGDKDSVME